LFNSSCFFQVAFFWEGNDPENEGKITYSELHVEVCKFANVLRDKGVKKVKAEIRLVIKTVSKLG
jgi:acyl-coenzyme A synthetase/AMP-(fatty) acid ligase